MRIHLLGTALIALMGSQAIAQSALRVSLTDRSPITVALDGRYFNTRGESVTLRDIPYGRHYLKIFIVQQRSNGSNFERVIYEGRVRTWRDRITSFTFDPVSGRSVTTDDVLNMRMLSQQNNGRANSYNNYEGNDQNKLDNFDRFDNSQANQAYQEQDSRQAEPVDTTQYYKELPPGTPVASPVNPEPEEKTQKTTTKPTTKFAALKKKVDAKKTDTERLDLVKKDLGKTDFTSAQVAEIMGWFHFDDTRVTFAKWAYSNTTDQIKFSVTRKKLTDTTAIKELDDFLKSKQ